MDNINIIVKLNLADILENLDKILQKMSFDKDKIESIKSKLIISTVYENQNKENLNPPKMILFPDNEEGRNRCKGEYKSGPKKGLRCETIIKKDSIYCKKHQPNNNMGGWAKNRSKVTPGVD
jgi:hypothetical protein